MVMGMLLFCSHDDRVLPPNDLAMAVNSNGWDSDKFGVLPDTL